MRKRTTGKVTKKETVYIEEIETEISYKNIKNVYLRIDPQTAMIRLSVPKRTSVQTAIDFVKNNIEYVHKRRGEILEKISKSAKNYESGEMLYLFGKGYEIEFVPSVSNKSVCLIEGKVVIEAPTDCDSQYRERLVHEWYRQKLYRQIKLLERECVDIAGRAPKEWRIKAMKTRWGTCNYKDERIWMSLQLATKPEICIKYVMLHELAHFYVHNHGPEFTACMDRFMPEWREVKKLLNNG